MIGLVFVGDIIYCPYLEKYTDVLRKHSIDYEVVFWNRSNQQFEQKEYVYFNMQSRLRKSKVLKVFDFLKYRKWVKNVILTKNYEKIVVLDTLSGIILKDILEKSYFKRFIYDIRDYSYERFSVFKKLERHLIDASHFTSISSPGFRAFLPDVDGYINTHNITKVQDLETTMTGFRRKEGKIRLVWMGAVRYFDTQSKIISKLANDDRFELIYHGIGPQYNELREFAEKHNIKNVVFTGCYENSMKEKLLSNADLINNCYDHSISTKHAISNKFYDGMQYRIPQLVETDCYKADVLKNYCFGIALSPDSETFSDDLYCYYQNIDAEKFNKDCVSYLTEVRKEECRWERMVTSFLLGE